jgi:hypothetical protein
VLDCFLDSECDPQDKVRYVKQLGCAMIKVARDGYPKPILESADIDAI